MMAPIQELEEAEYLRQLRNDARKFMTHNQEEISEEQQANWFKDVYMPAHEAGDFFAFLYWMDDAPVGYGLIRKSEGRYWLSGAVEEGHRGAGIGRAIFSYITDYTLQNLSNSVYLDVFTDNEPAMNLYKSLGFEEINRDSYVAIMIRERYDE